MRAWIYVLAAAAVLLALWAAYARRWWHALRYSMRRARHLADLTQTEAIPGAEYIGAMMAEDEPWLTAPPVDPDPWLTRRVPDWREQTRAELSPEALDSDVQPDPYIDTIAAEHGSEWDEDDYCQPHCPDDLCRALQECAWTDDSGPGGGAVRSSPDSPATPGPDWLAAQMADTFAWVRAMVPQVTGWSVAA